VRFARLSSFCGVVGLFVACGGESGDPHSNLGVPPPTGKDKHIRQIADPQSPDKANHGDDVDRFDETADGKSAGAVYVQDLDSSEPYAAISLYNPSFVPGNLRVGPGDVLDLRGTYQENKAIGTAVKFAEGAPLPQLSGPISTLRFDGNVPAPLDIDVKDLEDYAKGRRWLNMLVRVKNVTLERDAISERTGERVSAPMLPGEPGKSCDAPFPKAPALVNELMDLNGLDLRAKAPVKSITGVVTYFCNFHLAPRSPADIEK
jgi:hypothetical protein